MFEQKDLDLLYLARAGDKIAFEKLFNRYHQKAFNVAYRTVGSIETAEDMVMDAFIKVYESEQKINIDFAPYFYRIVIINCINYIRKNKRVISLLDQDLLFAPDSSDPVNAVLSNESAKDAFKALSLLPENQKIAFVLIKYEGLSYKEVSLIMKISVKAIESLMSRAKQSLKDYYFKEAK